MQIIEEIKNNELISNPSEIQKICLDKLKLNPLPNIKSEYWRLSNKSKFSRFLDHSNKNKESKVNLPYKKASQNIIRLIIGENNSNNLEKENYSIKELKEIAIVDYIKKNISNSDQNDHWSDLLNHCLSSKENILGLNISGNKIPPLEIFSASSPDSFNAKTLILLFEKNSKVDLLQINLGNKNSSLSQSTYLCLEENTSVNHGVVSYGESKSNLLNSLNVIQKTKSEYSLGSVSYTHLTLPTSDLV